jgi:hypothetical protein
MAAMFFLPLGYDVAFFMLQKLVDSYVITTLFFYLVSASFFGLYFLFSGVKPKLFIKKGLTDFGKKIRNIINR